MKKWERPVVSVTYVPRHAELLARRSTCIGARLNRRTGHWLRVYSRDETPLADIILLFHVEHRLTTRSTHGA